MSLFEPLEKFINEHGSATILGLHLSFIKEQYGILEKKVSELERQAGASQAKLEIANVNLYQKENELKRLQEEHAEEIRIHRAVEFRRGKRTGHKWIAFCPNCHTPATDLASGHPLFCSAKCGWDGEVFVAELPDLIRELDA